jgi:hypothetical protein
MEKWYCASGPIPAGCLSLAQPRLAAHKRKQGSSLQMAVVGGTGQFWQAQWRGGVKKVSRRTTEARWTDLGRVVGSDTWSMSSSHGPGSIVGPTWSSRSLSWGQTSPELPCPRWGALLRWRWWLEERTRWCELGPAVDALASLIRVVRGTVSQLLRRTKGQQSWPEAHGQREGALSSSVLWFFRDSPWHDVAWVEAPLGRVGVAHEGSCPGDARGAAAGLTLVAAPDATRWARRWKDGDCRGVHSKEEREGWALASSG